MDHTQRPLFLRSAARSCSLLLVGAASIYIDAAEAYAQAARPNVVFFMADDMGWTDWQRDELLNPNGSVVYETPNLLRLAQSGITFDNAYAPTPVCSSTRASILTGKTSARTRVSDFLVGTSTSTANLSQPNWTKFLPLPEITLAESLRAGGYSNGFFGKWHLGSSGTPQANPLQHGYDFNIGGGHLTSPASAGGFFAGSDGMWPGMPGLDTLGQYPSNKYLTEALADHAVEFIAQQAGNPFFLTFWDYAPHTPIEAPANLVAKYQSKIAALQSQNVDLRGHSNATYAAMIETMDQALGRLLDRLDDPNGDGDTSDSIRDNTIVIFTSDNGGLWASHGSPTGNLPLREGKGSLYEGGIREPLIVSWTGSTSIVQGAITDARTSLYDLYPTLLDLTGLDADISVPRNANMDGISIRDALEGEAFDRGHLYWHYPHISPQDTASPLISGGTFVSAVSRDQWKLLFFYDDRHFELYNLADDIGETTNVLDQNRMVAHELSQALHDYLASVNAQMPIGKLTNQPVDLPPVVTLPTDPLPELLAGDYNRDGKVDANDYTLWRMSFGQLVELGAGADGNGDGIIDAADYTLWRNNLGATVGGAGSQLSANAVPEPSSLGLALFGLMSAIHGKAFRRRRLH